MQAGTSNGVPVTWRPRAEPLTPVAVAARGDDARLLARRVLALGDPELGQLQGFVTGDWLVLLAEPEQLPWTPGVRYLGRDPEAPQLLMPTVSEPAVAAALLQRGLAARFPLLRPPLLVLAEEQTVLSAAAARTLDRERLRQWVEGGT
jgi:hypothetical protein